MGPYDKCSPKRIAKCWGNTHTQWTQACTHTHTHLHTCLPTGVERGMQRNEKWVKQTEKYPQRREDLEKIHIISPKRKMHLQMRAFDDS